MDSVSKASRTGMAAAVAALTAILVWFGEGLTPWWPLTWFAPLPLLWYALRSRWWSTAIVSVLGFLIGSINFLGYFLAQGMSVGAWFGTYVSLALMGAAGVLLFRWLVRRGAVWIATLALPALWVTVDWLRFWYTPHGTSADLAYTQLEFLPFLQLASVTGPWGMSFLLLFVPSAVAVLLRLRRPVAMRVAVVLGVIVLSVPGFGLLRLSTQPPQRTLRMG